MASNASGHHQDRPSKDVPIDAALFAKIKAVCPKQRVDPKQLPFLCGTVDGFKVYVIRGSNVMLDHDADFTQGGNGYEDAKLCPKDALVLDDNSTPGDWPFILSHELHEAKLMRDKGLSYDAAHVRANALEMTLRRHARARGEADY